VGNPVTRLAVLASGSGTILESMLAKGVAVDVVVADRACRALEVAAGAGIEAMLVVRPSFGADFDRPVYTAELVGALGDRQVDVVAMAGFMTVLSASMFDVYGGRVLNTHPSLLPAFPGAHAVRDALAFGVKLTGCTVHLATERMDDGTILAQEAVAVLDGDTEDTLHERIKAVERNLYPTVVKEFLA
jgi:phosphoribosylglycinamide formyltransferase-1